VEKERERERRRKKKSNWIFNFLFLFLFLLLLSSLSFTVLLAGGIEGQITIRACDLYYFSSFLVETFFGLDDIQQSHKLARTLFSKGFLD